MTVENTILHRVIALCSRHSYIFKEQQRHAPGIFELGALGVEIKQNICNEWWYSTVTSQRNIHGVECPSLRSEICSEHHPYAGENTVIDTSQDLNSIEETDHTSSMLLSDVRTSHYQGSLLQYLQVKELANKQLPFGTAQKGICFRHRKEPGADRFIFDSQENTQLSLQYYCLPGSAAQQLDSWQRLRLDWWRKFAQNPSNFTTTDIQTKGQVQTQDIQYRFPWGPDTIETISNRGQLPMDELLRWMEDDRVDYKGRAESTGIELGKDLVDVLKSKIPGGMSQLAMLPVLAWHCKARHGRKQTLPHTIETVAYVEAGMLAYLLDGYSEKQDQAKTAQKDSQKGQHPRQVMTLHVKLAPIKVAVVIKGSANRSVLEISQYIQDEFRKANVNTIELNRSLPLKDMYKRADGMGVLFTIFVQAGTVTDGTIGIRSLGETIVQGLHITQVKDFVQRHLGHDR